MVVVVIDGPEKSGKSTLVESLRTSVTVNFKPTVVRKWGKLDDGRRAIDSVYAEKLTEDSAYEGLVIWDRSWASEAVYGRLLKRDRRLAEDPWLGEWLYGRGVRLKFILGGPDPSILLEDRTHDDLPVKPYDEQVAFLDYGIKYGWSVIGHTDRERLPLDTLTRLVSAKIGNAASYAPRQYCGPDKPSVVFVGDRGSANGSMPGGWLPFSSVYTTRYGRVLGDAALRVGWTNAWNDRRDIFEHAKLVVACGHVASRWAEEVNRGVGSGTRVAKVHHPAALYRWGNLRTMIEPTEAKIRELVGQYIPLNTGEQ